VTRSLQDASLRAPSTRGITIPVAIGDGAGAPVARGQVLRLEEGTWSIFVARLVLGPTGATVAEGPGQGEPTWPVVIAVMHGRGAATWTELITCTARGTVLVRSDDYLQLQVFVGASAFAGWVADDTILLSAAQLIVPPLEAHVGETRLADIGGRATFAVPPGARWVEAIGLQAGAVVVTGYDSGGASIGSQTYPTAAGILRMTVPTTGVTWDVLGLAVGAPVTATYGVLQ